MIAGGGRADSAMPRARRGRGAGDALRRLPPAHPRVRGTADPGRDRRSRGNPRTLFLRRAVASLVRTGQFAPVICVFPMSEQACVIPDAAKRRSGIHSGALAGEVQAWIPGLPAVARDDGAFELVSQLGRPGKMA